MKKYRSKAYTSPLLDEIIRQNKKRSSLVATSVRKFELLQENWIDYQRIVDELQI